MSGSKDVPQEGVERFFDVCSDGSALLVIDMQTAFIDEEVVPSFAIPGAREIIPRIGTLLKWARGHGMPVIWTCSDHSPPYGGLLLTKFPKIRDERVLWRGERSAELYPAMPQPGPGEPVIVKHKYDAFFETDLEAVLRNTGVRTLIITGVATNICCESTARSAFMRDYQVVFTSDCTATFDKTAHEATLDVIGLFFGRVMESGDVIAELSMNEQRCAPERSTGKIV